MMSELDTALKEIELRKKYESFLHSVINGREFIPEGEEGFEWFCQWEVNR